MPTSFGEPLSKLRAVEIKDNGETLVDPLTLSHNIRFMVEHPKYPDLVRTAKVRQTVAEKLAVAADSLPDNLSLIIIEGFRPLHQQRFMYEEVKKYFRERHPEWSKATLHRRVNTLTAPPDDRCPPPHSTGAAVDLSLINSLTGEQLDMVSPYEWDESSAPTDLKGLSRSALSNRNILIGALTAAGMTNYVGEWWHWSWGDSGWALRVGAPFAHYDRLPEAGI